MYQLREYSNKNHTGNYVVLFKGTYHECQEHTKTVPDAVKPYLQIW